MAENRRIEGPAPIQESFEEQLALLNSLEPFVKSSLRDAAQALKQEQALQKTLSKVPPLSQRKTPSRTLPKHLIEALQREARRRSFRSTHIIPAKDATKHRITNT